MTYIEVLIVLPVADQENVGLLGFPILKKLFIYFTSRQLLQRSFMACKMKYTVHRVRFIDYVPQAIHCMAVEDCSEPCRLALSR